MNNFDLVKSKQDVIFQTLSNSLQSNTIAHAYLFAGVKGSLQMETVDMLVSSLVCQESLWSCGVCDACLRIKNHSYPDYIVIDGSQSMIKKKDILDLQTQFSLTALEESAYKIFLIKDAHNMTSSAANSLLKFLEEPSDNVVGILVSDKKNDILPTVISRCTVLDFKRISYLDNFELAKSKGFDVRDAYYYSKVTHSRLELKDTLENESYKLFKHNFERFINNLYASEDNALYIIQTELLKHTQKEELNLAFEFFIDMLIVFFKDVISNQSVDDWYDNLLEIYRKQDRSEDILTVVLEIKNKALNHINLPLLMDQMIYMIREA